MGPASGPAGGVSPTQYHKVVSWIEEYLEALAGDGRFDGLPGSGEPIVGLDRAYEPEWWAARWLERDSARQNLRATRRAVAADVAAALDLPRPQTRQRLGEIARAVTTINHDLDSVLQIPEIDVEALIIRGRGSPRQ